MLTQLLKINRICTKCARCATPMKTRVHARHQSTNIRVRTMNHRAMPFIYASGAMGAALFLLVIKREIDKIRERLRGFENISIPEFGSRSLIQRHKDTVLFDVMSKNVKHVESFEVKPDDVWVVSFPRSGTTWMQEIVYLIETQLNFEAAKSSTLGERFPCLELETPGIKAVEEAESPRYIKSHLPFHLLPNSFHEQKPKTVYMARNPRDVILSYFHYARMLLPLHFTGDFAKFSDLFLKNNVPYAPWWNHVLQFWQHRDDDNILFITYEQLHKNPRETIHQVATFLGKSLSDDKVSAIMKHCTFDEMRVNESVNHSWLHTLGLSREGEAPFMRSGKIGDWQSHFSPQLNVRLEQMLQFRLKDAGLYFDYYPTGSSTAPSSECSGECLPLDEGPI